MAKPDEQVFFEYLMMNVPKKEPVSPRETVTTETSISKSRGESSSAPGLIPNYFTNKVLFSLKQLDKLIDHFAKEYFQKVTEKEQTFEKQRVSSQLREL